MDFWFVFKKFVAIGLTPIAITLELVLLGLLLVAFSRASTRKKPGPKWMWFKGMSGDLGGYMIGGAALFLYLCSTEPVSYGLTGLLERKHPVLAENTEAPDFVVVLPGGQRFAEAKPEQSQIERKTLVRLLKGIEYWKQHPESTMVFSGLHVEVDPMRQIAIEMGVPEDKIFSETESRDTKDHPRYLKKLLFGKKFLLVTSGNHMPRSVALFRGQGLDPTPAPTDLHCTPGMEFRLQQLVPKGRYLLITDEAFHEHLGIGWAAMRKQLKERKEARVAFQKAGASIKSGTVKSSILEL